jgi:hypothetical protein
MIKKESRSYVRTDLAFYDDGMTESSLSPSSPSQLAQEPAAKLPFSVMITSRANLSVRYYPQSQTIVFSLTLNQDI